MPFLLVMDTGMMAIILLASSFFYETRNTVKSLFVSPVLVSQVLKQIVFFADDEHSFNHFVSLTNLFVHGVVINYVLAIYMLLYRLGSCLNWLQSLSFLARLHFFPYEIQLFITNAFDSFRFLALWMTPTEYLLLSPSYPFNFNDSLSGNEEIGKVLTATAV